MDNIHRFPPVNYKNILGYTLLSNILMKECQNLQNQPLRFKYLDYHKKLFQIWVLIYAKAISRHYHSITTLNLPKYSKSNKFINKFSPLLTM